MIEGQRRDHRGLRIDTYPLETEQQKRWPHQVDKLRSEEQRAVHVCEVPGVRVAGSVDIFNHDRTDLCAVALPQFQPVGPIVSEVVQLLRASLPSTIDIVSDVQRDRKAVIDLTRCIGCGLCVPTCPTKVMKLEKTDQTYTPPKNTRQFFIVYEK